MKALQNPRQPLGLLRAPLLVLALAGCAGPATEADELLAPPERGHHDVGEQTTGPGVGGLAPRGAEGVGR